MKKLLFVLAAVIPFLLVSCKGAEELKGKWTTTAITLNGTSVKVTDSFVEFEPSGSRIKVWGNAGVNTFNGEITAKDGKIESGDFATTRMMGSPEEMACEDAFLEIMSRADVYEIKDDILVLKSNFVKGEIKFKKQ